MMPLDITEQPSRYDHLERMSTQVLLSAIHQEDAAVQVAVGRALPALARLIDAATERMKRGGRMFYIGAGTSGRLGVLDASELPPTFGVSPDRVVALIAGGDRALRTAVEQAEDDPAAAWHDLAPFSPTPADTLVGIAASGRTPYVVGGLKAARRAGLLTACITCNPSSAAAAAAHIGIEAVVGPEFVSGSTRMKAGTATKLLLNMLSTCVMIKLGRVEGNAMIHMQLNNHKLMERAARILLSRRPELGSPEAARKLLQAKGSLEAALAVRPPSAPEAPSLAAELPTSMPESPSSSPDRPDTSTPAPKGSER